MRNTIIITVLLFIAVIAASILYFGDFSTGSKKDTKALRYLPDNTLAIASFGNDRTIDTIFSGYELFEAIIGNRDFQQLQTLKNDLLRSQQLASITDDQQILVSFHADSGSIETLYSIAPTAALSDEALSTLLQSIHTSYMVRPLQQNGQHIWELRKNKEALPLYCMYAHDVLFASSSPHLLTQIADKKTKKLDAKKIEYFINHNNSNTPLSLYFSNAQIPTIAHTLMRTKFGNVLNLVDSLEGQTAWNMNFKGDAFIFTGETELGTTTHRYIQLFAHQSPKIQALGNYLPVQTASYMDFSISDASTFHTALQQLFSYRNEGEKIQRIKKNFEEYTKLNFDTAFAPLFTDEFAVAALENQDEIGLISLSDSSQFFNNLVKYSSTVGDSIYQFRQSNLLYAVLGDPLRQFSRPYFTVVDHILVIANQTSILRNYRKSYQSKQFLAGTAIFKAHHEIQSSRTNVTYYMEPKTARTQITQKLKSGYAANYADEENFGYENFYSWSYQLGGHEGRFTSGLYARYKSDNRLGGTPKWSIQLDGRLVNRPWVFNYTDGRKFIVVQEQSHTVHAIDPDGKTLWSTLFQGQILGDPIQLQDNSIVAVTKSRLYRFMPDGTNVPGFSVELSATATYSPTLCNFNKEQCLYIPATDRILAYDLQGKKIEDFKNQPVDTRIVFDLKTASIGQTNYIIAGTSAGSVYFFDQQGHVLHKQQLDTDGQSVKNPIGLLVSSDERSSFVYVADTKGGIYKVPFTGEAQKMVVGEWDRDVMFNFEDVTGGADRDFVIFANNKLSVYNSKDGSRYFDYNFIEEVDNRPLFFRRFGKNDVIGVGTNNRLIYVFTAEGLVQPGFPIEGLSKFYFGPIRSDDQANYLICMKRDFKLNAYRF